MWSMAARSRWLPVLRRSGRRREPCTSSNTTGLTRPGATATVTFDVSTARAERDVPSRAMTIHRCCSASPGRSARRSRGRCTRVEILPRAVTLNYGSCGPFMAAAAGTCNDTRAIMLDDDVIEAFRNRAEERGIGYQTAINEALRSAAGAEDAPLTVKTLREVLRKQLRSR